MDDVLERALGRLRSLQTERLRHLLASASTDAGFYRRRLESAGLDPGATGLDDLSRLPLTGKADLVADQEAHPPWGSHLSRSPEAYVRLHKTSGTTGRPLLWVDTADSWSWFRGCWRRILELSGVTAEDRVFVAFSFGPFIGFWGAFEAAQDLGALALTGGALSSDERLDAILDHEATVLVSTPTYALRLAELAAERGIDLAGGPVRLGIHAGEPGARVPNVRRRLEAAWGMACIDHAGATEVGAWGVTPTGEEEMAILEEDFLPEVVDTDSGDPAPPDAEGCRRGELVLTNLGRLGSPVIRYRTGDLVEMLPATDPARPWRRLRGGVLGRVDGMVVVRGINVYPSAIENIVRGLAEIGEFRVTIVRGDALPRLRIEVEAEAGAPRDLGDRLAAAIHSRLTLTPEVERVPAGTLPRFELKARRFHYLDA